MCVASTQRSAALAAVPTHLALSATPLPKISSTCWSRKASIPGSTLLHCLPRARRSALDCRTKNCMAGSPRPGSLAPTGMPKPLPLRQIESFSHMPNDISPPAAEAPLPAPLAGLRVIEFSHMVMGPSCGMVLADLGADVVKIEPAPGGDNTRRLSGPAVGFFSTFNRNKRSLCIDVKRPSGLALVRRLIADADVLIENF